MTLGACKHCGGALAQFDRLVTDSQGRPVDQGGKPIPMNASGGYTAPILRHWVVACADCGRDDLEHPFQRELDAARAATSPPPRPAPAPAAMPGLPPGALEGLRAEVLALSGSGALRS